MTLSSNAKFLLNERYCREGETPYQLFDRVSEALSLGDDKFAKRLNKAMKSGIFLPASPTLKNAGVKKSLLHPCHVLPIHDSIEGIMDCLAKSAEIFHYGGGVGFNISKLRPKGAQLSSGGSTSGVVSFLGLFDYLTEVVKQGGFRRGALMSVLNHDHPEITSFIVSKLTGKLTNFNISVMITDEFMEKVDTDERMELKFRGQVWETIKAKDLFDQIVFSAYCCGDPGLLFFDRINKDNPLYPKVKINATNPCIAKGSYIATADGRGAVTIEQLCEEYNKGRDVVLYSWDPKEGRYKAEKAENVFLTRENAEIVKVWFDDNSYAEVTPDHLFLLTNGEYKKACELKEGESIRAFNRSKYVGETFRQVSITHDQGKSNFEHHLVGEFVSGIHISRFGGRDTNSLVAHHKDRNHFNNAPNNIEVKRYGKHSSEHISGDNNPMRRFPERNIFNNPEFQKEIKEKYHVGAKRKPITVERIKNRAVERVREQCLKIVEKLNSLKLDITKENWDKGREGFPSNFPSWKTYKKYFILNHKVVKVEKGGEADVYDISMPTFRNFVLVTNQYERVSRTKKLVPVWSGIVVHNCGEVPLPEWTACNLGAINLSKFVTKSGNFNKNKFAETITLGIRTLKNINAVGWYPFQQMTKQMKLLDPCGLGFFGLADALIMLGIRYDSQEALDFIDEVSGPYVEITEKIAKGSFYKRSQQPTGSLSIIANCSQGIEPVFERHFERHLTVGVIEEVNELYKSKYCRTAHEISPEWHLKMQAKIQEHIDSSVSKTVNLPSDASIDQVRDIYYSAWKMGCKGITIFRDGCKEGVMKSKCDGDQCIL